MFASAIGAALRLRTWTLAEMCRPHGNPELDHRSLGDAYSRMVLKHRRGRYQDMLGWLMTMVGDKGKKSYAADVELPGFGPSAIAWLSQSAQAQSQKSSTADAWPEYNGHAPAMHLQRQHLVCMTCGTQTKSKGLRGCRRPCRGPPV